MVILNQEQRIAVQPKQQRDNKMTEQEYLNATNLTKLSAARNILLGVIVTEDCEISEDSLIDIRNHIHHQIELVGDLVNE